MTFFALASGRSGNDDNNSDNSKSDTDGDDSGGDQYTSSNLKEIEITSKSVAQHVLHIFG